MQSTYWNILLENGKTPRKCLEDKFLKTVEF